MKSIKGYENLYAIEENGNIISLPRKKIDGRSIRQRNLKPSLSSNGYLGVILYKNGGFKRWNLHKLLAIAFIPNFDDLPCINHKDGNKQNNSLSNLEWCDYSYNSKDGYLRGRVVWNKGLKGLQSWHNISALNTGTPWNKGKKLTKEQRKRFRQAYRKTRSNIGNSPYIK